MCSCCCLALPCNMTAVWCIDVRICAAQQLQHLRQCEPISHLPVLMCQSHSAPDGSSAPDCTTPQGDACALPADLPLCDAVLAANLLCRLPDPMLFIDRLPSLVGTCSGAAGMDLSCGIGPRGVRRAVAQWLTSDMARAVQLFLVCLGELGKGNTSQGVCAFKCQCTLAQACDVRSSRAASQFWSRLTAGFLHGRQSPNGLVVWYGECPA
jgi:hypothetical protein